MISINSLILIVVLVACCVMPILYSIVITVLFVYGKHEIKNMEDEYRELEEACEKKIKRIEEHFGNPINQDGKKGKKKGSIGFAITGEEGKDSEEKDPQGKNVA